MLGWIFCVTLSHMYQIISVRLSLNTILNVYMIADESAQHVHLLCGEVAIRKRFKSHERVWSSRWNDLHWFLPFCMILFHELNGKRLHQVELYDHKDELFHLEESYNDLGARIDDIHLCQCVVNALWISNTNMSWGRLHPGTDHNVFVLKKIYILLDLLIIIIRRKINKKQLNNYNMILSHWVSCFIHLKITLLYTKGSFAESTQFLL